MNTRLKNGDSFNREDGASYNSALRGSNHFNFEGGATLSRTLAQRRLFKAVKGLRIDFRGEVRHA